MHIIIDDILFEIESDNYDGDLILISGHKTIIFEEGYTQLKDIAANSFSYIDELHGDLECDRQYVDSYIESNIGSYIIENFKNEFTNKK